MNVHLNILFHELQDIYTATYIFRAVDSEWDKRVREKEVPDYSAVRTILYEALVYRVILGLSKIFANNKEYSLSKAANQIEQIKKNNSEVKSAINEIRQKIDSSPMISKIRVFRDKFFAHLDKESVLSYFRIDPTAAMKGIDCDELEEWLSLIDKLYKTCFGVELTRKSQMPSKDEIAFFHRHIPSTGLYCHELLEAAVSYIYDKIESRKPKNVALLELIGIDTDLQYDMIGL